MKRIVFSLIIVFCALLAQPFAAHAEPPESASLQLQTNTNSTTQTDSTSLQLQNQAATTPTATTDTISLGASGNLPATDNQPSAGTYEYNPQTGNYTITYINGVTSEWTPAQLQNVVNSAQISTEAAAESVTRSNSNTGEKNNLSCDFWSADFFNCAISNLIGLILQIFSLLVYMAGELLELSFNYTILNLSSTFASIKEPIETAWKIFRDLINITFIFGLLYIAIGTILQRENVSAKKLIPTIIIGALLINFSLFFTQIIIDFSNNFAVTIYNQIDFGNKGIAGSFIDATNLKQISSADFIGTGSAGAVDTLSTFGKLIITGVAGSALYIITSFIFFVIALLLLVRFIKFIMLMIMSPVAIGGGVFPQVKTLADDWWKDLSAQAMFAPVFFLLLWIVMKLMGGLATSFSATSGSESFMALILKFALIIGLLVFALVKSNEMSATGAKELHSFITKTGGGAVMGATAWAGRNTVGRFAARAAENMKQSGYGSKNFITKGALLGAQKIAGSSLDIRGTKLGDKINLDKAGGKGGFTKAEADAIKQREEFAKDLGKTTFKENKESEVLKQSNLVYADQAIKETERKTAEKKQQQEELQKKQKEQEEIEKQIKETEAAMEGTGGAEREKHLENITKLKTQAGSLGDSKQTATQLQNIGKELKAIEDTHKAELKSLNIGYKGNNEKEHEASIKEIREKAAKISEETKNEMLAGKSLDTLSKEAKETAKQIDALEKAGKERQKAYATSIAEPSIKIANLGINIKLPSTQGAKQAAINIRKNLGKKSEKDELWEKFKGAAKEAESTEKPKEAVEVKEEPKKA